MIREIFRFNEIPFWRRTVNPVKEFKEDTFKNNLFVADEIVTAGMRVTVLTEDSIEVKGVKGAITIIKKNGEINGDYTPTNILSFSRALRWIPNPQR